MTTPVTIISPISILLGVLFVTLEHTSDAHSSQRQHEAMMRDWYNRDKYPASRYTRTAHNFIRKTSNRWKKGRYGLMPKDADVVYRQECRTLPKRKFQRLFRAIGMMMKTMLDENYSMYQAFAALHIIAFAPGAHFGPGFFGWHREFLCRLETALRKFDPDVALCYIDWRLESCIPNPLHSALWTDGYLGPITGQVRSGMGGICNEGCPIYTDECVKLAGANLTRNGTYWPEIFSYSTTNFIKKCKSFKQLCFPWSHVLEFAHGMAHNFVSGHMGQLGCAPCDPVFFLHHCFIDHQFQIWRNLNPTRCLEYPKGGSSIPPGHRHDDIMQPFDDKRQIDGHNLTFDNMIKYAEPPMNCMNDLECGSEILWCNTDKRRCCARIRLDGDCAQLPGNACYDPKCPLRPGICVARKCKSGCYKYHSSSRSSSMSSN